MERVKDSVLKRVAWWGSMLLFMILSAVYAEEGIAVVMKVNGTVEAKSCDGNIFKPISVGTILFEKDL